jgi:hypothetical protein
VKFKLDENIGRKAEQLLRDAGHDVSTVTSQSLNGTNDENLFEVCIAEQRALVTLDHDFGQVLRFPPMRSAGIVILEVAPRCWWCHGVTIPQILIRDMGFDDVAAVGELERQSYPFPWSEAIFRDCLRARYYCCVVELDHLCIGYGIMSTGPGEAHVLNICWSSPGAWTSRMCFLKCARRTRPQSVCINRRASARSACAAAITGPQVGVRMRSCCASCWARGGVEFGAPAAGA